MSFSLFKKASSLSFVFDIRDSSISVAVANFEKDKKPEIVLCQNFPIKYQEVGNHKKYITAMLRTLDKAVISSKKELIKIGNKEDIKNYHFFIGSPWTVSQAKTIKIIKDRFFEINNKLLDKIIIGEEFSIEKNIEEQTLEPNWKVLEERIIQSKINGYKVDSIFGRKTTNLAVELFVSFIPYEIKDKLSSYIDERIGKKIKRQDNSRILPSYTFFRDLYSNKNDFIYVDIGNLITDVYAVRDDIIFGVASFPYGEENIMQASLEKTNLSRDILASHLSVGLDKKFDLTSHNNGVDLLKSGFEAWKIKLSETLSKICTEMNIPNNMFIIPNSVVSNILANELSKKDNDYFEILDSRIEVSSIVEGVLNSFVLNGKSFLNEPHVKMDVIFLDKMLKNNN
jgi:hypothetical protein